MNDSYTRPAFPTINPATLATGKTYTGHSAEDAARKARLAAAAQQGGGAPASSSAPGP